MRLTIATNTFLLLLEKPRSGPLGRRTRNGTSEPLDWDFTLDWQDIYNIDPKIRRNLEKGKKLIKRSKRQMIERVVAQVRNRVPHCERKTFVQVMKEMKLKYPRSFRHELAQGIIGKNSLVASMQAKFDNDKRGPRRSQMEIEAPNLKAAYGCIRWRVTVLPEGEFLMTCITP